MDARIVAAHIASAGAEGRRIAEAINLLQQQLDRLKQSTDKSIAALQTSISSVEDGITTEADLRALTIVGITAALTDPNDFGDRWWKVTVTFSPPVPLGDMTGTRIFVNDPAFNGEPDRGYQPYTAPGTGNVVAVFQPMSTARTVTVSVYPATQDGVYNASRGDSESISLGPVSEDGVGIERCANVTGQGVTVGSPEMDANGVYRQPLTFTFTKPTDTRWAKVQIVAKKSAGLYDIIGEVDESGRRFLANLPSSVQTWRFFFRSGDRSGKWNSLNEGPTGVVTPYADASVGTASGTLDVGKAEQSKLSSMLEIASGVLGIKDTSITAAKVAAYTLTGGQIADLAISRSSIIGTGVILTAHIGDAQITSAKIASLQVDKISGWSGANINVGAELTFSTTSYRTYIGSYGITTEGRIQSNDLITGTVLADRIIIGSLLSIKWQLTDTILSSASGDIYVGGDVSGASFKVGGTQVVGSQQGAIADPSVTIPTSGSVTADSYTGDAYNTVNELQDKVEDILAALRAHGLIDT